MSDIIAGRNAVREALRGTRPIQKVLVLESGHGGSFEEILSLCAKRHVAVERVNKERLDRLSPDVRHQGVVAVGSAVAFRDLDEVLEGVGPKGKSPFFCSFSMNCRILRTLVPLSARPMPPVSMLSLFPASQCSFGAVVAKISAGALEHEPVVSVTNLVRTMKDLKKRGFWIVGADMDGKDLYFDADLTGPLVLVVGAEGKGVGRLVKENCDFLVRIPMLGQVQSLNASVAGGILLYEITRQRIISARKA